MLSSPQIKFIALQLDIQTGSEPGQIHGVSKVVNGNRILDSQLWWRWGQAVGGGTSGCWHSLLPIAGIQHLNDHESGQGHGRGLVVVKDVTVDAFESFVLYEALRLMGLE